MKPATARRLTILGIASAALVLAALASLYFGSNRLPFATVTDALLHPGRAPELAEQVVRGQRVPRTAIVALCGVALAVAGVLMQAMTRNPLAEPGILGVNAGAALGVVLIVALTGLTSVGAYLWAAFAGAGAATVAVYFLSGSGRARPAQLALAGVAVSMAIGSVAQAVILLDQDVFNEFRYWAAGSAQGRGTSVLAAIWVFVLSGVLLALLVGPALNGMALGEDVARGLGVNLNRTRAITLLSITLLAGAATAAIGPIMFLGLAVGLIARWTFNEDMRWAIPGAILFGPAILMAVDVVARFIVAPQEIQVGVMTALIGGPIFVAMVRGRKVS